MVEEVASGLEIYRSSNFWTSLNTLNNAMIDELGLKNFKRTVSQNYFNWLVISRKDIQFKSVLKNFLRRPTLQPLLNRMRSPELLRTTVNLESGIGSKQLLVYKLFVGMLWELAVQEDWAGLSQRLEEPLIGNPIEIRRKGKLISQDLANSIREYNSILSQDRAMATTRKRVAELGAGYGRLGYVFAQDHHTSYYIFDIPPALSVSQWYLRELFPQKKIFQFRPFASFAEVERELEECDLAFFTPNQLEMFPDDYFAIFLSISTLPEMSMQQVEHYLQTFSRLSSKYVYLKQWSEWLNPSDQVQFSRQHFDLDANWTLLYDRIDSVQSLFFERLWQKQIRLPGAAVLGET